MSAIKCHLERKLLDEKSFKQIAENGKKSSASRANHCQSQSQSQDYHHSLWEEDCNGVAADVVADVASTHHNCGRKLKLNCGEVILAKRREERMKFFSVESWRQTKAQRFP